MIKQTGVRQYVGARYVPLICGEWNPDIDYEPLSIVTYFGNSYTSKVPVPAGTLPTDTAYWAKTGNFNAQLEDITNRVEYLENNRAGECIFIGDDIYSSSLSPILSNLQIKLSRWFSKCTPILLPGYGFSKDNPKNMLGWLSSYQYLDTDKVTSICCFMGTNDVNTVVSGGNADNIVIGIQEFIDAAKKKFKNAQIIIGFTGFQLTAYDKSNEVNSIYKYAVMTGGKSCTLQGVFINLTNWTNNAFNASGYDALESDILLNIMSSYTEVNASYNGTVIDMDANVKSVISPTIFTAFTRKDSIITQFISNGFSFNTPVTLQSFCETTINYFTVKNPWHFYSGHIALVASASFDNGANYIPLPTSIVLHSDGKIHMGGIMYPPGDLTRTITNIYWGHAIGHFLGGI